MMIGKVPTPSLYRFLNDEFYPNHFVGKSDDTKRTYDRAIAWFEDSLARRARVDDLSAENLERFHQWAGDHLARSTMRGAMQRLRTLWRAANKAGQTLTTPPPPWWWSSGLPPTKGTCAESKPPPVLLSARMLTPPPPGYKPETLREYLGMYLLQHELQKSSAKMLGYRLNQFEKFLGHVATFDADLNEYIVSTWVESCVETMARESARSARAGILALWRAAFQDRIIDHEPRRVRKIKKVALRPKCWTMADLDQLLRTAERVPGGMNRSHGSVKRADFWAAWILTGYYSGIRFGDLCNLRWSDISTDGILTIVQNKTGDLVACQLPVDVLEIVSRLHGDGRLRVFGDLLSRRNIQEYFPRLVRAAGLIGSTKWLRKSGASHIEHETPGGAPAFLGHRSDISLARASYIDPVVAQRLKPLPPRIEMKGT